MNNQKITPENQDPKTKQFLPGNPGGGRPKGSVSIVSLLKKKLQEKAKNSDKTYADLLVQEMLDNALIDHNANQIKTILQYVDGTPKQINPVIDEDRQIIVKFMD